MMVTHPIESQGLLSCQFFLLRYFFPSDKWYIPTSVWSAERFPHTCIGYALLFTEDVPGERLGIVLTLVLALCI